ncbi:MAG: IMS domain-containing protein [Cyanobacteria bacterium J06639_14]
MRIPLDYYRILGLPIQATAEQLKQAHRDRTLQLPRREYSEIAIEARKSLFDEAYSLLSDTERRKNYDAQFLTRTHSLESAVGVNAPTALPSNSVGEATLRALASDAPVFTPETYTPTIEIDESQFVGALLILLELGEYELVIRLGRPFLTSGSASLANGRYGDPQPILADIVLTLALSCLELGREQWQQSQYENAAESLETGQELLLRENVFPGIRAELQADLYKLRPYRILELVARPLEQAAERRQGIQLLKAMLHDRGGIDGAGDDLSGLTVDDFLRFIQQLRGYLAAGEQQEIFEGEARRPSAVATYLAVYALLARGFAFHQPALVRRAKQLLGRLSSQQDVHLEQAVCALLLGQAEQAGRALELSQEYEPLAFIREHSQNAPDLLPGLCLYAERWLREEVFSHFRDLAHQQTALKDYFANPQVQAYLESMPLAVGTEPPDLPQPNASRYEPLDSMPAAPPLPSPNSPLVNDPAIPGNAWQSPLIAAPHPVPPVPEQPEATNEVDSGLSVAERVSQLSPEGQLQGRGTPPLNGHRPSPAVVPPDPPVRRSRSQSPRWGRLVGVFILGILAAGTLGFITINIVGWISAALTTPKLMRPSLNISLADPAISIPSPPPPEAQINVEDIAERAISSWLSVKNEALGETHDIAALENILLDPALTSWRNRAEAASRENWHSVYDHTVEILNVEPNDPSAAALTVEAQVREIAEAYELGLQNFGDSYDTTLTMQYDLVQQEGEWFVKEITKLE